jgi:hypothetical protein
MANTTSAPFAEGDFRVGRVISRSISILSRRFVPLFVIAAGAYLPSFLISLWMRGLLWTSRLPGRTEQAAVVILLVVAYILFSVLGQAMIVHAAFQDMRRQRASLGASVKVGLRRFLPLFGITIVLTMLIVLSFALFIGLARLGMPFLSVVMPIPIFLLLAPIPIVAAVTVCFVTTPACVVEKRGPLGSVRRSAQLTKGHRLRIFGLELLLVGLLVVTGIFISSLGWVLSTLPVPLAAAINGLLWNTVWVAYCAVTIAVAYHDLRVAKEGVDIEQIASVFD